MNRPEKHPGLHREQVRQLYDQSIVASLGAIAAAIILAIMLYGTIDSKILFPWASAAIAITILRYVTVLYFHRMDIRTFSPRVWETRFVLLILASGVIWGSAGIFLYPTNNLGLQMILFFVLVALTAGASDTFSTVPAAFFAYTVPTLIPISLRSIIFGDHIHAVLGYGAIIFLLAISMYTMRFYAETMELIRLKFENIDLFEKLAAEKAEMESMNENLRAEISERNQMENVLADHKKNLEKIVAGRTMDLQEANTSLQKENEEKRRAEKALKKSEEKYRLLVENANDAICIFQDGMIKFHNQHTETMLGFSPEELGEMGYFNLFHPDEEKKMEKTHRQIKQGIPIPPGFTLRLVRKDGKTLWTQLNGIFISWEGRTALLAIFRDITRQRHLERHLIQSQKMEAIGSLAGGVAHDINNILGGINGNISLLLKGMPENDPAFQRLSDMETYIKSGSRLTRQLLGMARPGKSEIKPEDITAIVHETAQIFSRTHKNIRVIPEYDAKNAWTNVDAGQIEQVFLNLMVNAGHAMPNGGSIYLQTKRIDLEETEASAFGITPGNYIRISVTDTGVGIKEEVLPKIFEPFFTTRSKEEGTGLGLYTAYRVIRENNGHITVYSKPENGTTFNLYLPESEKQPANEKNGDGKNRAIPRILTGTETILLVEDEQDILDIGKEMLEAMGYTVITANSGNQAISIFKADHGKIDMVILDLMLPDKSGGEVFSEIKAVRPDVRALLASGFAKNGKAAELLAAGCRGFIQKPYNISQLSSAIRKILDTAS
ncbi:MAG: PAS domain S-box protein [Deltaproteobacteria bacterium]|nr:PAS domain S-box protein [Deltaproteobacteria bacterium]